MKEEEEEEEEDDDDDDDDDDVVVVLVPWKILKRPNKGRVLLGVLSSTLFSCIYHRVLMQISLCQ